MYGLFCELFVVVQIVGFFGGYWEYWEDVCCGFGWSEGFCVFQVVDFDCVSYFEWIDFGVMQCCEVVVDVECCVEVVGEGVDVCFG